MRGATTLAIFEGRMDSDFYQQILEKCLVPFIRRQYPDGHRFMQDNDPKHTSRSTRAWFEENAINYWPTPPESPDSNPIENLWHQIKEHLRRVVKPNNKDELVHGIQEFWTNQVTPELCTRYIGHLRRVIPEMVEKEGAATGY